MTEIFQYTPDTILQPSKLQGEDFKWYKYRQNLVKKAVKVIKRGAGSKGQLQSLCTWMQNAQEKHIAIARVKAENERIANQPKP